MAFGKCFTESHFDSLDEKFHFIEQVMKQFSPTATLSFGQFQKIFTGIN
jgi:hypothetical protein